MVDEVGQGRAAQGVEVTQAVVQDDTQANLQLQVFCFVLCRLFSPIVTVHFASSYVSLVFLLFTLTSRYLAASPNLFLLFLFLYFSGRVSIASA